MFCTNYKLSLPDSGLLVSANKYQSVDHVASQDGMTLVLAHCSSGHKELWEPVLSTLFGLSSQDSHTLSPKWRVREAWALDAQNHGESAMLNKTALQNRKPLSIQEYADMLYYFARSDFVKGREIVAVGHSASTSAWTIACARAEPPLLRAIILIEPVMVTPPISMNDPRIKAGESNTAGVLSRKEVWNTYEDLAVFVKKRFPWKIWDTRVLDTYLKYGFIEVEEPATGKTQVMPKSLNAQEVGFYYADDHVLAGTLVDKMCSRYQVHVLFGERPEMVSLKSRESICDASAGRSMVSVSIVRKCGHLAVQENPDGVAEGIYAILRSYSESQSGIVAPARL